MENIYDKIESKLINGSVRENVPLKELTTFRVGGPAKYVVTVTDEDELSRVLSLALKGGYPYFLLGNGSNILASDDGYDGIIIKEGGSLSGITISGNEITAGAGAMLSSVCIEAKDAGLTGLEFAYGIPGSVGGAMVMNAGAYGGEMKDVVKSVNAIDERGNRVVLSNSEMEFEYRNSVVRRKKLVVTSVVYSLKEGNRDEIKSEMEELMGRRRDKQPLNYPSAGSTFKRPEGYFAGKLIMDAGLSGFKIGGAMVSEKHCGFVINSDNATASDVDEVIKAVTDKVKEAFGVTLTPEVIRLGAFKGEA